MAISVVLVMFSAIVHEVAHGWMALKLGDPTAKEAGRLTLDPRAHLDGFGSVALPLIMAVMGGPVFAFAKPVPYDPRRLRNPGKDDALVALAGPVSNILQALLGTALVYAVWNLGYDAVASGALAYEVLFWAMRLATTYVYVNLTLAFFNLIPLPPLDGSKVVAMFLSDRQYVQWMRLERYGMIVLMAALWFGLLDGFLGTARSWMLDWMLRGSSFAYTGVLSLLM